MRNMITKTFTFSPRSSHSSVTVMIDTVDRARTVHRGRAVTVTPTAKIVFMVTFDSGDKTTIRTTRLELDKEKEKIIKTEYT